MKHARLVPGVAALALAGVLAQPQPARAERVLKVDVRYVHAERVFLAAGTEQGVKPGALVEVFHEGKRVARLKVDTVNAHRSSAVYVSWEQRPVPGDSARIRDLAPPPAAAAPVTRRMPPPGPAAVPWPPALPAEYPLVAHRATGAPVRRARAQAFLRTDAWGYLAAGSPAVTAQQRLMLRLDAPLDARGRLRARVHAHLVGQVPQTRGSLFEAYRFFRTELYEASVAWRTPGLELGVGRAPAPGLRYGLVDGLYVAWRFHDALTLRGSAGARPETVTLLPDPARPALTGNADGSVRWGWGSAAYGASLSWLGRNLLVTEGSEAGARVLLELGRLLWVDVDAAGIMWLADNGSMVPRATLERLGTAATLRQGPLSLRLYARRHGSAPLPSERWRLPLGYLVGVPLYEVGGTADLAGGGDARGGLALSGGAAWDNDHFNDRLYLMPEVHVRLLPWWDTALRAGWRTDVGPTTSQLLSVGVSTSPAEGLRFSAWQQGGVWFLYQTRRVAGTWSFSLNADYRMLRVLVAGVRARALFNASANGETLLARPEEGGSAVLGWPGHGMEATAWVGADGWDATPLP